MWDIVWVSPQGHRSTDHVCKSPFPSAGTAVSLFCVKTENGSAETTVAEGGQNLSCSLARNDKI